MNITGEEILLRAIELSDKDILLQLINDAEIERFLGGWAFPVSSHKQENWIKSLTPSKDRLRCMVEVREDGSTIGMATLSDINYKDGVAEVHLKLVPSEQSKGYGTETLTLMTQYAFDELRLNCVYAQVNANNVASQNLFEKCGFQNEGILRDRLYKDGQYEDAVSYSMLKEELDGNRWRVLDRRTANFRG